MLKYLLALTVVLSSRAAWGAPEEDLVPHLPGLAFEPSFRHYSGYLAGDKAKRLHYWFVESSNDPSTDPLVLWLNGGPGCSSMLGLLTEQGPFRIKEDAKTVVENPFAWNKVANMIFLESPAGVGFSYDPAKNYTSDDDDTAMNNYKAMKDFFRKFPEYADRDFYITGESYGGIYVPALVSVVLKDPDIKLKGFAVGNGASNKKLYDMSLVYYMYYHGIVGDTDWYALLHDCCPRNFTGFCDFPASKNPECQTRLKRVQSLIWKSGLNVYNLYAECYGGVQDLTLWWDETRGKYVTSNFGWPFMFLQDSEVSRRRQLMLSMPRGTVDSIPPCTGDLQVVQYLNRRDVKQALHVSDQALDWTMCSDVLNYTQIYYTMKPNYEEALKKKLRILVYNGDIDMACNVLGDEWFVDSLNTTNPQDRRAWYYTAADGTKQIAGFVKTFDLITFITIKGSGHMVPKDKPKPALDLFVKYIQNKPF